MLHGLTHSLPPGAFIHRKYSLPDCVGKCCARQVLSRHETIGINSYTLYRLVISRHVSCLIMFNFSHEITTASLISVPLINIARQLSRAKCTAEWQRKPWLYRSSGGISFLVFSRRPKAIILVCGLIVWCVHSGRKLRILHRTSAQWAKEYKYLCLVPTNNNKNKKKLFPCVLIRTNRERERESNSE